MDLLKGENKHTARGFIFVMWVLIMIAALPHSRVFAKTTPVDGQGFKSPPGGGFRFNCRGSQTGCCPHAENFGAARQGYYLFW